MSQHVKVAVFIDLENLRYSLLNLFGEEPDFKKLVEKAKKYGRPSVMRAYADFTEHPRFIKDRLHVAGIEAINVPVKKLRAAPGLERIKNAADMILALDAMSEAMDADANENRKVFLLVTGDADYIRLVNQLKHLFGQRVIVAGVEGSTSAALAEAADELDPIETEKREAVDKELIKGHLIAMVRKGPAPLNYWTFGVIEQWTQSEKNQIPGNPKEIRDALHDLLNQGILAKRTLDLTQFGKHGTTTETYFVEEKAKELGYLK